ncbi:hypothetical protein FVE85_8837 [Porphyridium purpureum]|uniref:Uncharacterized protein n=1 Tax=Porphyridium purpureum TaxID=35688 RepID=A0A5J4YRG6_PORPP|nr:hypothetical protein FVE85_8837 [Porphyridium purpureum]|eukprot:POR7510..scf296_7
MARIRAELSIDLQVAQQRIEGLEEELAQERAVRTAVVAVGYQQGKTLVPARTITYDGERDLVNITTWISAARNRVIAPYVEELEALSGPWDARTEKRVARNLSSYLCGNAALWWIRLKDQPELAEDFLKALEARFVPSESYNGYDRFLDKDVRIQAELKGPTRLHDFIRVALEVDAIMHPDRAAPIRNGRPSTSHDGPTPMELGTVEKLSRKSWNSSHETSAGAIVAVETRRRTRAIKTYVSLALCERIGAAVDKTVVFGGVHLKDGNMSKTIGTARLTLKMPRTQDSRLLAVVHVAQLELTVGLDWLRAQKARFLVGQMVLLSTDTEMQGDFRTINARNDAAGSRMSQHDILHLPARADCSICSMGKISRARAMRKSGDGSEQVSLVMRAGTAYEKWYGNERKLVIPAFSQCVVVYAEASGKCEPKGIPAIVVEVRVPTSEVVKQRLKCLIVPVADLRPAAARWVQEWKCLPDKFPVLKYGLRPAEEGHARGQDVSEQVSSDSEPLLVSSDDEGGHVQETYDVGPEVTGSDGVQSNAMQDVSAIGADDARVKRNKRDGLSSKRYWSDQ